MRSDHHPQDDLLIVEALIQYAVDLQDLQPDRAAQAEHLATEIAAMHGLELEDALWQIEYATRDVAGDRNLDKAEPMVKTYLGP